MAGRRILLAVVVLAAVLHGISIARSLLPAQDGLKFIRIARQFQNDPWPDVVRDTDQHSLYPALIAAVEPLFARWPARAPIAGESRPSASPPWRPCSCCSLFMKSHEQSLITASLVSLWPSTLFYRYRRKSGTIP